MCQAELPPPEIIPWDLCSLNQSGCGNSETPRVLRKVGLNDTPTLLISEAHAFADLDRPRWQASFCKGGNDPSLLKAV